MNTLRSQRIKILLSFVRPFRFAFVNLFICVSVTSFIGMFYPYIFSILIDEIFYHRNMDFFLIIVITYGTIYVGETLLHLILNSVWAYLMTRYLFDIRRKAFAHIHTLPAKYLDSSHTGDLVTIINKDAGEFMNLIHWNIFYLFANIIRFLTAITFVYLINAKLALLMLIAIPISIYATLFFGKKVKKVYQSYRTEYGTYISWLFEMLNGIREIKLFAGEAHIRKTFSSYWKRLIHLKIRSSIIELLSERANSLITLLADLSLYVLAGILIVRGELTIGGFVAIIDYFLRGKRLLQNLNEANIRIQNNLVSIDKVLGLLGEETESDSSSPEKLALHNGHVEYKNVSFAYTDQHEVLKNISLAIESGKKLALVGSSGSGKSTLASLLLRFYEPENGDVFIDQQNIQDIGLKSLRDHIGIVRQEPLIFQESVRYNLKLGKPNAPDAEIWGALQQAHVAHVIRELPDGLGTVIGKNGMSLSGGQLQRISIARIFLKNPKILIFDEATSSLDYESEKAIHEAWEEVCKGRTSIIIAHRLSTVLESDTVAVIHDGHIVSLGHHSDLLQTCEKYQKLFKEQYFVTASETV